MHAHNDNTPAPSDTRPPEFDAMLLKWRPGMVRMAHRMGFWDTDADDLITDTMIRCMTHWQNYRVGGSPWNYLYWTMRGVAKLKRERAKRQVTVVPDPSGFIVEYAAVNPDQEYRIDLGRVLNAVRGRDRDVLLRRADGDTLADIANDIGTSREMVRKVENAARRRLVERVGAAYVVGRAAA